MQSLVQPAVPGDEDDAVLEAEEGDSAQATASTSMPESTEAVSVTLPSSILLLREELLHDYACPANPPSCKHHVELEKEELLSLRHYIAWHDSNSTVDGYAMHAHNLELASALAGDPVNILSLYLVRQLALKLTVVSPAKVDICPKSCIAYAGKYANLQSCPYVRNRTPCGEPRYRSRKQLSSSGRGPQAVPVPRAQMLSLSVSAPLKALYANGKTASEMRYRDRCLQEALCVTATAAGYHHNSQVSAHYSDYPNAQLHEFQYNEMGLFQDCRDVAFVISSDGAQLTVAKMSDTWILIIMLINLPPHLRYLSRFIIRAFATPGPNPPADIESRADVFDRRNLGLGCN